MKNKKALYLIGAVLCTGSIVASRPQPAFSAWDFHLGAAKEETKAAAAVPEKPAVRKPKYVRGIHLTSWVTGSPKLRAVVNQMLDETELNTVVVDVKEYEGEVYIPGVRQADEFKSYVKAIPDLQSYLASLKSKGIYTIARIVVFKDNIVPRKKPEWSVKNGQGTPWKDRRGITWLDPYNKEAWNYNIGIAERCVELGFDEIQFDYIRFPSDGNTKDCHYCEVHNSTTSANALVAFLKEAHDRLKPKGVNISIDVFGLTTTVKHDMGIGQKIVEMAQWVDYVSPMVYPSHYNKYEYNIPDPNKAPYKTVYLGMEGAKRRLGADKLRPYLQDFSLGYHYGAKEVRAQIQATYDNDIGEWLLWNPRCVYTRSALKEKKLMDILEKSASLPEEMQVHTSSGSAKAKKVAVKHTATKTLTGLPDKTTTLAEKAKEPSAAPADASRK
jgi:hypothetical protein